MNAVQEEQKEIMIDGYWVDAETGEYLRPADVEPKFVPDTPAKAEWVLEKMLDHESAAAEILRRPEVLEAEAVLQRADVLAAQAVMRNAGAMAKPHFDKRKWLETQYGEDLKRVAQAVLAGQKERTWKTLWGSVSLRAQGEKLETLLPDCAVELMEKLGFDGPGRAVKKEFKVSGLTKEEVGLLISALRPMPRPPKEEFLEALYEPEPEDEEYGPFTTWKAQWNAWVRGVIDAAAALGLDYDGIRLRAVCPLAEDIDLADVFRYVPAGDSVTIKTEPGLKLEQ